MPQLAGLVGIILGYAGTFLYAFVKFRRTHSGSLVRTARDFARKKGPDLVGLTTAAAIVSILGGIMVGGVASIVLANVFGVLLGPDESFLLGYVPTFVVCYTLFFREVVKEEPPATGRKRGRSARS